MNLSGVISWVVFGSGVIFASGVVFGGRFRGWFLGLVFGGGFRAGAGADPLQISCTESVESARGLLNSKIISTSVCFIRDRANWISSMPGANFKLPVQLYITLLI